MNHGPFSRILTPVSLLLFDLSLTICLSLSLSPFVSIYLFVDKPLPPEPLCFSIVTESRTVDFAAESLEEAQMWKRCLRDLMKLSEAPLAPSRRVAPNKTKPQLKSSQSVPLHGRVPSPPRQPIKTVSQFAQQERRSQRQDGGRHDNKSWMQSHDQLFQALRGGDFSAVEYLLKIKGVSVHQMDSHYQTPLMIACQQNSGHLTRLCLEYGARIDEFPEPLPTALHSAARSRSFECMSILIQSMQQTPKRLAGLVNRRDSDGNTALHISSYSGDANILELLVCHGADLTIEDSSGRNALHLSALYGSRRSLMVLLDQGGDSCLDLTDSKGYTPLHYCAEGGYRDCVELLLGAAADPSLLTLEGFSPYDLAAHHHQTEICQMIERYTQPSDPTHSSWGGEVDREQQSELLTFTSSSLREEIQSPEVSDDEQKTESRDGFETLTAARALQLAMRSDHETRDANEEMLSREYQLHLIDNGLLFAQGEDGEVADTTALIEQTDQWMGATEPESILPIEEFQYEGCLWHSYLTEEGYQYFLNSDTHHSQWDDPRVEGVIEIPETPHNLSSPKVAPVAHDRDETVRIPSRENSAEKGAARNGKTFNRPRQLHSPLQLHFSTATGPSSDPLSSPSPSPRPVIDRTTHHHQPTIGKTAWMETLPSSSTPTQSPLGSPVKPTSHQATNSFSPDRSFVERAKTLRKNAPFPLSSPPQSLRVAAMRAHHESERLASKGEPWASPTHRVLQSPKPSSPSLSRLSSSPKQTPTKEPEIQEGQKAGRIRRDLSQEALEKSKSFEFKEGSYGCGGNMYAG
jgi:ankyrin repeat protein